eukprot:CAMPEP_0113277366 /NCGR_PEP_ID=MMETSP0008_2-20120614/26007_1 /TAXON_ID=97485 /ORGANISM="Prymnesium parvum" /LENGTH=167 /DNA_ID=CAMNT_0000127267 /DNA_START=1 /DNA_END=504 /DNA_ORIENTATION=- /assembly_acc=CAM_ASM_000153
MLRLKARITDAVQTPWQNTEHLQLLRYEEGQFYLLHHDQNSPVDSAAGPRVFTFFLYLSSVAKGGETVFPRLNLTVHPRAGRALVWASVRDDDVYREDPRTEHEARPVLEGVKYAANFWTHLRDFQTPHAARCGSSPVATAVSRRKQREQLRAAHAQNGGAVKKDEL